MRLILYLLAASLLIYLFLFILHSTPSTTYKYTRLIGLISSENNISTQYLQPHNEFVLNPAELICDPVSNKDILLITMVPIKPNSFDKRAIIRKTWGNANFSKDMKLIFLLAKSANEAINQMVVDEFAEHKDIVQKDYIDSYRNLTAKIMFGLNWVSKYCANSKYILRINDDVVVNTYLLIRHFKSIEYKPNLIYGYTIAGVGPIRSPGSKFYVSEKDYPKNYYETYIEGSAYLFTTDLASVYYKKYLNYHFPPFSIWLEDVYIGYVIFFLLFCFTLSLINITIEMLYFFLYFKKGCSLKYLILPSLIFLISIFRGFSI